MNLEFLEGSEKDPEQLCGEVPVTALETGVILERAGLSDGREQGEATDLAAGTPETDMENWHKQNEMNSCAVCCQEFIAEQLLGQEFSEEEFARYAEKEGWYDPKTGMAKGDIGNLLEALGLDVERESDLTLADLFGKLEDGDKLICCVNNMVLSNPEYAEIPGILANHAVEVIGIDYSDPEKLSVVLNDSGTEDGKGRIISAETFVKAWETSGRFVVTARKGTVI